MCAHSSCHGPHYALRAHEICIEKTGCRRRDQSVMNSHCNHASAQVLGKSLLQLKLHLYQPINQYKYYIDSNHKRSNYRVENKLIALTWEATRSRA